MTQQTAFATGIDVGGTTVKAGAVTGEGRILGQAVLPSRADGGPDAVLGQIVAAVREIDDRMGAAAGGPVGVGMPGMVSAEGLVRHPPNIRGWGDVDVTGYLRRTTGRHVVTENDANCAALAESKFGAGKRFEDFIFVIWGTGIGGGIIIGRKIFRGAGGGAGEIGHVSIDMNGPLCNCGNRGCVESYIGQRYLSERTKRVLADGPPDGHAATESAILRLVDGDPDRLDPAVISKAAEGGDPTAVRILTEAGRYLGVALSAVVNTIDVPVAIVGGGISAAPDFVLRAAADEMRSRVLQPHRQEIVVERALLGNNAGVIGAASLVL